MIPVKPYVPIRNNMIIKLDNNITLYGLLEIKLIAIYRVYRIIAFNCEFSDEISWS